MSCTIYLVRHGETDWNIERRLQGSTDIALNQTGRSQAVVLQKQFENISFDAIYSSNLLRAKETAEIIATDRNLIVTTTTCLRERSWGDHEGQIVNDIKLKYGDAFKPLIEHFDHHQHDELHPDLHQVESYSSAVERTLGFLKSVRKDGSSLLAVSHGGIIKGVLLYLYPEDFKSYYVENTAFLELEVSDSGFALISTQGITHKPF